MKTERMVLLITPEEKARIGAGAVKLGVSASEYVRQLVAIVDADDIAELESLAPLLPAIGETIDSIERNIAATLTRFDEAEREREHRRSDSYRREVREELLADPTIDWDALSALLGPAVTSRDQAA